MRTYAATDKLFLTYHPQSEERHIRLVTELSFSAISTEQLEGGVSPYEPVVTISPVEKQGRGLLSSQPPCLLLTTSTEHHCYPAGLASYGG